MVVRDAQYGDFGMAWLSLIPEALSLVKGGEDVPIAPAAPSKLPLFVGAALALAAGGILFIMVQK